MVLSAQPSDSTVFFDKCECKLSIKASDHQLYVLADFLSPVAPVPIISNWLAYS